MVKAPKQENSNRLVNFMEELAGNYLNGLITDEFKGKRFTSENRQDIMALALNRLWPMYTTTNAGRDFLKKIIIEDKIEKDIVRELRIAIDKVRANPRG